MSVGGFAISAPICCAKRRHMNRPQATPLREQSGPAPRGAKVIDAQFKVVRPSRLALMGRWLFAFAIAGAVGFLIPPAWVVLQEIAAMLRGG